MGFTLSSVATTGLPAGQYVVRVEDVEAGVSAASKNDKITFSAIVAHSDNPEVRVGTKEIWSYTYAKQHISILANDLVRAGLPKDLMIEGNATLDAKLYAQHMRGNHYVVNVVQQKKDPTRTNTSFVAAYNPAGLSTAPQPVAQVAVPAAVGPVGMPTIPFGQPPQTSGYAQQAQDSGAFPPGLFPPAQQAPAPQAQPAWGNPPPAQAQNPFNAQPAPQYAPNPMPQFGQAQAPNQAPPQSFPAAAPLAYAPPAQQVQQHIPNPAAQAAAAVAPDEAPLNPEIIQALQRGERPPLNGKQLAQLTQVGWTQVVAEYAARAQQPQFNPAMQQAFDAV
jgi:hypothetical protein